MYRFLLLFMLAMSSSGLVAQITDDFSDGEISHNPRWMGDTLLFTVNPPGQLQLQGRAENDTVVLYTQLPAGATALEWRWWIRLNFSPSDNNLLRIYLGADGPPDSINLNAYYIEIGENGSADAINFFRQKDNQHSLLAKGKWAHPTASDNTLQVRVTYLEGNWRIFSDSLGQDDFVQECEATDTIAFPLVFTGIWCRHTKSNADRFFFDHFYAGPMQPDTVSPVLLSVRIISTEKLELRFSEPVRKETAEQTFPYHISREVNRPALATRSAKDPSRITLTFPANTFEEGLLYSVACNGIMDVYGNMSQWQSRTCSWKQVQPADVVVNEILFNPVSGGVDYVEIYNRSRWALDLSDMMLWTADRNTQKWISGKNCSDAEHILLPGEYRFFTTGISLTKAFYPGTQTQNGIILPSLPPFSNDRGTVILARKDSVVIDRFDYRESFHSPFLTDAEGVSLERVHTDVAGNDSTHWQSASSSQHYGTPGYINSQFVFAKSSSASLWLNAPVLSPDQDGHDDVLAIFYRLPGPGCIGDLSIYDVRGRGVRKLARQQLMATEESFFWDGLDDDGNLVREGCYLICFRWLQPEGNKGVEKRTCSVRYAR